MNHQTKLGAIELGAQEHRRNLDNLRNLLAQLEDGIESVKRQYLPSIRRAVGTTRGSRLRLAQMIQDAPDLFVSPKSREAHGLRIGFRKEPDKWLWPNMAELVSRVRERLGTAKAKALIQVQESVPRKGLTTEIREQLDITCVPGQDRMIIEPLDGEVDKIIQAMLGNLAAEIDQLDEQEAA